MSESQLRQLSILVGEKLKEKGYWITCAESCTGGGIAKAITDIAGSSAYFDRGFVTYSNAAKRDLLGVAEATLTVHGAVSAEVVREMALGALHVAKADLALSVSGIAGPEGGSEEKPVGTVWFGFADGGRVLVRKGHFVGDRDAVRLQKTVFALRTTLEEFL
ncbi:putative competence/damage-inducible protein CinA [Serratia symbiotica str. Tucson]|uniref:Competence/damage-inducible protein CinA n=2 Tax=Serratia symbiotica TaxID=138074 RepID=A0A455VN24_9GAMM|nr:nicotinamide-nucleotide amidase [Serratia symbiotica]EFW11900.1 putative competence/damage-inducible protein CinA [Serratia symbiotica str. Tucson]BBI92950.1 competence/damage-inducible protein CinA [Serratia symbiotica]